ncbi:CKLF-like MARVEL transmembrane domain-containing protein 7 [Alligator sinensis]|uniref:CKLF-like MARVEL transmembrane domain-containing protein 7 n=1 Tax=Alligator sinensis TaxID=38654 RepID=A0A3Q0HAU6_ALLSI|nr:CKLF-like MARVEL transmembrane domain-containing protein 7 [Alligator sinensis]
MVSLLIGFICVNSSVWTDYSAYSYFQIVSICDLIMIGIFYLVYIFRVYKMLSCISWPLAEFLHYLIGTVLLFIACIVAASKSYNQSGLVAGAVFGFLATFLCILSMWSSYKVSCVTQSTAIQERIPSATEPTVPCPFSSASSLTVAAGQHVLRMQDSMVHGGHIVLRVSKGR